MSHSTNGLFFLIKSIYCEKMTCLVEENFFFSRKGRFLKGANKYMKSSTKLFMQPNKIDQTQQLEKATYNLE